MDQASNLRNAIIKKDSYDYNENKKQSSKVICVSSGKGGVGKSNFTLNLALALRKKNKNVIIIDADLGLANIEILLGQKSKYNLNDIIKSDMSMKDVMLEGPMGIKIISGGSGISEIADLSLYKLNKILNEIDSLKSYAEYILIDTGAGISKSVLTFVCAANEVIVVTNPEPTSIADSYALIKACISDCKSKKINVLINNAETSKEANIAYETLSSVANRFLNYNLNYLGVIHKDKNVNISVKKQIPFYINAPSCVASKDIEKVSNSILCINEEVDTDIGFAKKIYKFLSNYRR